MKNILRLLLLLSLAGGLAISTACKNGDGEKDKEKAEAEETDDEETEEEGEEENEAEKEAEKGEIDKDMYIEAAYEVACVNKTIDDPEQRKEIKTEIYARYGFDEAGFNEADSELGDDETVNTAVETRLEKCTKEQAEGFAQAGDEGEKAGDDEEGTGAKAEAKGEKKADKPAPKPVATGNFTGKVTTGLESGTLRLTVTDDFKFKGVMKGKNEGKSFRVNYEGVVKKSDRKTVSARGKSKQAALRLNGTIHGETLSGKLTGKVFGKDVTARFKTSQ